MFPGPAERRPSRFLNRSRRLRRAAAGSLFLITGLATLAPLGVARADSLRCDGHLISDGDSAATVAHVCGAPSFRDRWRADTGYLGPPMMEWTYNRGPRRLLEQVIFRGGQVISIRTAGYGFIAHGLPASGHCNPVEIQPGESKFRLLETCGRPLRKTGWFINSSIERYGGHQYYFRRGLHRVYRERWIYNFGANRLLRAVMLENARVVAVNTLKRGFNPH